MALNTTSTLPAAVQQSFDGKLLSIPVAHMIHKIVSVKKSMPANGGTTLRMRRYNQLDTAMVPLGNTGETPPADVASVVDIDAKVSFYGKYMYLNEQVTLQSQDNVLNAFVDLLGVSMRRTEDHLTRDMLMSTASFINCTGGVNGDRPTEITRSDVDLVTGQLYYNNGKFIEEGIEGSTKFGTAPIRDSFVALGSAKLIGNLDNTGGFVSNAQYPSKMAAPSEWGSIGNLRFFLSSEGSVSSAASMLGADVYNIFCVAKEAYASIEQDNYSSQFIYHGPEFSGPLNLNASVGYKFAEVPRILNDLWILNLRTTLA